MFIRTHRAQLWHLFVSLHFGITTNKWVMCNQRPRIWQPQDCQLRLALRKRKIPVFLLSLLCEAKGVKGIWLFWTFGWLFAWFMKLMVGIDRIVKVVKAEVVMWACQPSRTQSFHSESHFTHLGLDYLSDRSCSTQRSPPKMTALKSMTRRVFSWKPGAILCCRDGAFQR